MPVQHSHPARQTRSQARAQSVLTPTPRVSLDGTSENSFSGGVGSLPGLSRTIFKGPGEDGKEEEENSVEEEDSGGTEGVPAPLGESQGTGWPTLCISNQSEPPLLEIIQQMTQIMANLQAASFSEAARPPDFKTPSMKAPEFFDGTQPFKVRNPNYLLNPWNLFESQLFTLFEDPNEVIKAEAELDSLRMKEGGHFEWDFLVIDTPKGEDLILGFDFLNHLNPSIEWRKGLITFNADVKDYYDPSKYFSNDFSSAKSCAALVGDSRKPLFSSSVHIPFLNSHQSLLSSRDESFKEIQGVGEDNSISSLHLLFGNMDLPPSSYHDSLEEV
ncbi:hypothetical protein O181_085154 [Austropuccinia psidii MF-1]|uniref:Uncharacterized protein n=1 Tax=Austropuccinia psidii MF-1 TaxID=1389203 RepID=A0A9Q3IMV8_9BASI|nr:hypothetical protein [Austropuccinia psidii MF-1]